MAERLGIRTQTLDAWEQGRNRPKDVVELAESVEREFGVPAAWVLGVLSGRRATDRDPSARATLTRDQWAALAPNLTQDRITA